MALAISSILALLLLPSVAYLLVGGLPRKAALYALVAFSLYGLPLAFVHGRLRDYATFLYRIALFSPVVLLTAYFGLPFDDRVMLFAREAGGVASKAFAVSCAALVLGVMALFRWLYLASLLLVPDRLGLPAGFAVSVFSCAVLATTPLVVETGKSYGETLAETVTYVYPFNLPRAVFVFTRRSWQVERFARAENSPEVGVTRPGSSSEEREVYIFILGETARYDHWAVNGYPRDTSPELARIPGLLSYSDVSAPSYCTSESTPVLLTSAPSAAELVAGESSYPSLPDVFGAAGFETLWVGNLASTGTPIVDTVARRTSRRTVVGELDGESASALMEQLRGSTARKTFAVLHTAGNHWRYADKYPPSQDVFRPSGAGLMDDTREQLVNAYDNSIRYADGVIAGVIKALEKENCTAVVFYVSDHGEHLLDDDRNLRLHAFPTEQTVHVPLFVWYSKGYEAAYPGKVRALKAHRDARIGGSDIFPTVVDLADLRYPGLNLTKSFASPSFRPSLRRVTGMGHHPELDYDQRSSWPRTPGAF